MRRIRLLPKRTEVTTSSDRKDSDMEQRKSSVEELLETEEGRREFMKEELGFEATEKIAELMEIMNVSKSELAKRTGNSKAYITQVLSGTRNMTVHTLAGLAFALGYRIMFNAAPITNDAVGAPAAAKIRAVPVCSFANDGSELERAMPASGTFFHFISSHLNPASLAFQTAA